MGPTISIRRPSMTPQLPIARLHGADADFERAQRSVAGAIGIALMWLLPIAAMAMTIGLAT